MKATVIAVCVILTFAQGQTLNSCTMAGTGRPGVCKGITACPVVRNSYIVDRVQPTVCNSVLRTVCCPLTTIDPSAITTTTAAPVMRISAKKCREYGKVVFVREKANTGIIGEQDVMKDISKCNHESVPLIVGGEPTKEAEFPHMALIGFGEGTSPEDYQCGGSLISEQWILSAAHCAKTRGQTANFAKLGNVHRTRETPNSWKYKIVERITHPDYKPRFVDDDIALLKLETPAVLNIHVIPICLPDKELITTKAAIATGFGQTGFAEATSSILMKVTIDFFANEDCSRAYAEAQRFVNHDIDWNKMVCAGSHNKSGDTCNGDSGGPLQIFHADVYCMYKIIGITSFGSAYCGFPGMPAIYTKVFNYLSWIESIVWPNQ